MASREAKEQFVTGLAGGTRADIAAVVMIVPVMTLALAGSSRLALHLMPGHGKHPRTRGLAPLLGDFYALVLPEAAVMMSHAAPGLALAASGFIAAVSVTVSSQLSTAPAQRRQELNILLADFSKRIKGYSPGQPGACDQVCVHLLDASHQCKPLHEWQVHH